MYDLSMPYDSSLDFQDSEVSIAELRDNDFIIRFSAARIHRENEETNVDDGPGFIQALELTIHQATIIEHDSGCIGRISNGSLRVDGTTIKLIPIPYDATGIVEIELAFSNGSMCKVIGQGFALKTTGEARVTEWLKC